MRYRLLQNINNIFSTNLERFKKFKMSALETVEIGPDQAESTLSDVSLADVVKRKKEPKRVLYFSDGTIEEYDSDDTDEDGTAVDGVEQPFQRTKREVVDAEPPVDPKTLTWPAWIKYFTKSGGSKTLNAMDRLGEGLAYYLGITTPKNQYEIDEYYRSREEELAAKKQEDAELQTWVSPPSSAAPVSQAPTSSAQFTEQTEIDQGDTPAIA